jgi:hypothetical protein
MVLSLSTFFEKQEDLLIFNLYANGAFLKPISNLKPISQEEVKAVNYYSHPKFTLMERNLYKAQYNLPKDLTDPFEIF